MDKITEISALLKKTAERMTSIQNECIDEVCPIGIINVENWEWPQGVGMYALYKLYKETGKEEYFSYLIDWYERRIAEGLPEKNVNTMAPMLTLAFLYEETRDERYLKVCNEWVSWIANNMPRTKDGGIQHIVTGETNEGQLWDDTLYMTVMFLAKMGMLLDRKDYIEESIRQFLVHTKYLFDKKTGLWFHGWTFKGNHNFAEALWARGNSWITAGIPDYIEITGVEGAVKQYLIDTLNAQIEGLAKFQRNDGMWHTLIDDSQSYVETSATAGFGYGILKAARCGYVDFKYRLVGEKALSAVIERIAKDGTIEEVSYGTGMGKTLDDYRNIPLCPMTYGQALAIMILCEGLKI